MAGIANCFSRAYSNRRRTSSPTMTPDLRLRTSMQPMIADLVLSKLGVCLFENGSCKSQAKPEGGRIRTGNQSAGGRGKTSVEATSPPVRKGIDRQWCGRASNKHGKVQHRGGASMRGVFRQLQASPRLKEVVIRQWRGSPSHDDSDDEVRGLAAQPQTQYLVANWRTPIDGATGDGRASTRCSA